jgi:NarL family two-component system response regulator LiaR
MLVRVLIAEDHAVVRQGLRLVLSLDDEIDVVGETDNGKAAVALARQLRPDVVLMDLLMPVMDGIEATIAIRSELPDVQVVVLTSVMEESWVAGATRAGAIGYLDKNSEAKELREAVKAAAAGQTKLSPAAITRLIGQVRGTEKRTQLTERETEVLILLARGKANKEIARELHIGQQTVKSHVSNILAKLGAHSRTQAALYAVRMGLLSANMLVRG